MSKEAASDVAPLGQAAQAASSSASADAPRVEIKKWNAVALWSWGMAHSQNARIELSPKIPICLAVLSHGVDSVSHGVLTRLGLFFLFVLSRRASRHLRNLPQ
jgi:hypothetical protein